MREAKLPKPVSNRRASPKSLKDADMTTVRVDRRSFLSRAVAAGSLAAGAALSTGCPGGSDGTDPDSAPQ